ncbi:MAG TPA: MFS transporter [Ignavibacteria bacterium]|nr:MFS transporter [Ignavibacteria bacterium]
MLTPLEKKNVFHYFVTDISVFISVYLSFLTMVWIDYTKFHSSAQLGVIGFAQNVPFMLFSVYGGVIADRYNRRKIIINFNFIFVILALVVFFIFITNNLTYPVILICSFMLGGFFSLYYPSMIAIVKDMIADEKEFPKVMGAAASNAKIGQLIASSSFSFLIAAFSAAGTFLSAFIFNVIAYFSFMRVKGVQQQYQTKTEGVFQQIKTGLSYTFQNKVLLGIILAATAISSVFVFVTFQLVAIDSTFMGGGSSQLGVLFIAGAVGGLTSGIYLGKRKSTKNLLWFLIICIFVSGASLIGLAFSRTLWLSFIFAMGVDFAFIATMGMSNTLLQLLSDPDKCGRVLGVNTMFCWGVSSVIMMLFGFFISSLGLQTIMIIVSLLVLASGVIYIAALKFQKPVFSKLYKLRNIPDASIPY